MKFTLALSILSLICLTACINHYYNLSMEGSLRDIPNVVTVTNSLREDEDVVAVQYQHYPPATGAESAFDHAVGAASDHTSDTFLIQTRNGRSLELSFQVDQGKKTVMLFQQEWQPGGNFQEKEPLRLMADFYRRLLVRLPSLPPFEALKQKVESGSAH